MTNSSIFDDYQGRLVAVWAEKIKMGNQLYSIIKTSDLCYTIIETSANSQFHSPFAAFGDFYTVN